MFLKHEVLANEKLNRKFNLIKLKAKNSFKFKPGQFVTLKVTNSIFRCYSIFSSPNLLPGWEMFIDISPGGPGTTYLKKLKKGDVIETSAPAGTFTYEKDGSKNVIFAGTGCGIAPLLPILRSVLVDKKCEKTTLYWGLRYIKDIVLESELKAIRNNFSKFDYEIILSQPERKWKGRIGHVQKPVMDSLRTLSPEKTSIYLSGNGEFIQETLDDLKKNRLSSARVYLEKCY